jgi:hypothetical protein
VHNVGRKFYDIWAAVENQRFRLHNQFGEALLRPYFGHLYEPLDRKEIKVFLNTLSKHFFHIFLGEGTGFEAT